MAYYNKTTEKTSIDRKIADTDVTSELSTSKELGLYQSYNPTGTVPVTNQVREFDWGTMQPAINTVVGGVTNTAVSTADFIANHPDEVVVGVVGVAIIGLATAFGGPAGAFASTAVVASAGLLSLNEKDL